MIEGTAEKETAKDDSCLLEEPRFTQWKSCGILCSPYIGILIL